MARAVTITDATFKAEVFESVKPILVDFWAAWCTPCHDLVPVLEEVAHELDGRIRLAKLDVESNPASAANFGVQGLPTLILFKDGRPAERIVGAIEKAAILERLRPHMY